MIAVITIKVGLFIFWLLISFIIGLFVAFAACTSAVNASIKEHDQEHEMRVGYKA